MSKVIVVGGGPSGMMAALTAAKNKTAFTRKRFGRVNKCAQDLTSAASIAPSANS